MSSILPASIRESNSLNSFEKLIKNGLLKHGLVDCVTATYQVMEFAQMLLLNLQLFFPAHVGTR